MEPSAPTLDGWLSSARVLIVDDEPANLKFLHHVLETEGYGELVTTTDAADAAARFAELDPDVVIVDLWMPQVDGFEFISRVQALLPADTYLPILVVTGDPTPDARRRALSLGARDFLAKPLSPSEIRLRVRNLMETRFLHEQMKRHNVLLEQRVDERTRELAEARLEILYRLARAAEFRDDLTGQHTLRVGRLSGRMAQVLGLCPEQVELIARAAPLHDVGKIGIPDSVLLKQERLDAYERSIIETHTVIGAEILSGSSHPLLQLAEEIALNHHERWDGMGYPRRLAAATIPIAGRIVAVADVFDALSHERPYKPAWTTREALAEIEANAGTQFDPQVVEALLRIAPEAAAIEAEVSAHTGGRRAVPVAAAAVTAPPLVAVERTVAPGDDAPAADAATLIRRLQDERDVLLREVEHLRQQLARREIRIKPQPRTSRRASRPN